MAVVRDSGDRVHDIIMKSVEENLGVDPLDAAPAEEPVEGAEGAVDGADAGGADGSDAGAVDADPAAVAGDPAAAGAAEAGSAGADEPAVEAAGEAGKAAPAAAADGKAPAAGAADAGKGKRAEDAFAKEHGVAATDKLGRPNRIPYPVVRDRIVPNAIKKAKTEWAAKELAPVQALTKEYETRLESVRSTEQLMFGSDKNGHALPPAQSMNAKRTFLNQLVAGIPGYRELIAEMTGSAVTTSGKDGDGTKIAQRDDDPEPQPDAKNEKGEAIGYTVEGFQKLRAWDRRQAEKAAEARIEQRFKPLLTRDEQQQASERLNQSVDEVITGAARWPGFTENHQAILAELAKGKDPLDTPAKMTVALQDAYNTVMFGAVTKHKETEEEARARHFEEFQSSLRRAPRSTAASSTVARREPPAEETPRSNEDRTRDIIIENMRRTGLMK